VIFWKQLMCSKPLKQAKAVVVADIWPSTRPLFPR